MPTQGEILRDLRLERKIERLGTSEVTATYEVRKTGEN